MSLHSHHDNLYICNIPQHANAFLKSFSILGGKYRGQVFNPTGYETLRASASLCANPRAAHFFVFPDRRRKLAFCAGLPILDRAGISRHAQTIYDSAKLKLQQVQALRAARAGRGLRGRGGRLGRGAARGYYGLGAILPGENSDVDPSDSLSESTDSSVSQGEIEYSDESDVSSLASDDDFVAHAAALALRRAQSARAKDAPPPPPIVRPIMHVLYIWNSRGGLFEVRITAIQDDARTATFDYVGGDRRWRPDTHPWAELFPKGVLPARR